MKGRLRKYFLALLLDSEMTIKETKDFDERLVAYGSGLLVLKICDDLKLIRKNELDVWEARLTKLTRGEEANG